MFFERFLGNKKLFSVPTVAPDVMRVCAKSFIQEDYEVKLQTLNLCGKMSLIDPEKMPEQLKLAISYVFSLARYDQR